jgi:PAS domain S-box-containing protein
MDTHHKTKEQLIAELQELQEQNRKLKQLLNANTLDTSLPLIGEDLDFIGNNYFELVFNTSPDAALISRLSDSKIMKVNDGFSQITGYSREEALESTSLNLWKHQSERQIGVNTIIETGICENFESTFIRKDGSTFIGLVSAKLFTFEGDQYISSFTRDITELKRTEKLLYESNVNARTMMEASKDMIMLLDKNGIVIDINQNVVRRINIPHVDLIGKDIFQFLPAEHARKRFMYFNQVLETGKSQHYEDFRNGFWNDISCFPVFDMSNNIENVVIFVRDITERKKAENENERIKTILEESQRIGKIGGWELNIDTMELLWTSEMYAIQELDSTFIPEIDKRQNFFTPDSLIALDEAVKRAINLGETYDLDVEIITAKGNKKNIKTICQPDLENRKIYGYFQDITERKKSEEALKRSEYDLKRAQEITHIGSFYIDLKTNEVTWSDELYKMYGFDPAFPPPLFNESKQYFTPESWELLSTSIANLSKTGKPYELELKTIKKDGSNGWLLARGEAANNVDGEVTSIWGAVQDITERKLAENALKESEEKYRLITEFTADVVWVFNITTRKFTYISPSVYQLRGFTSKEAMNQTLEDSIAPNSIGIVKDTIAVYISNFIEHPEAPNYYINEIQQNCKNGDIIWVEISSQYRYNPSGEIEVVGVSRNIEKRKNAEQELKESEEKYKESQQIGNVAHWEYNFTTEKLYWSDQLYKIYELSKDNFEPDLSKALASSHIDDHENIRKTYLDSIKNKTDFQLESRIITPSGNLKCIITKAKPKFDENGNPKSILATVVDITERKNIEEELKRSQNELRNFSSHLLKVRENERAAITLEIHDSVAQYLVALKMEMGIYINKMLKSREKINSDQIATRMESFVAQIEKTIKSTRMIMNGLRPEQLELLGLIETIEVHLQSFEEIHHIKCNFENTLTQLNIEQEKSIVLFRIFQESLINILKHANATKVDVKLSKIKDLLMLEIIDNGVGFDQNQKGKEDSFGLVSMKEQIKQMNGTFTVTSEIGKGTLVRVVIPYNE